MDNYRLSKPWMRLRHSSRVRIVQIVTMARIGGAVAFSSIALTTEYRKSAAILYLGMLISDLLDGWLARRMSATTEIGAAFDGVADKYVTVASTLFLAAIQLPLVACCIILLRDVVVQGLRAVPARRGQQNLFLPNRFLGGVSGLPVRALTIFVLFDLVELEENKLAFGIGTWCVALGSLCSLLYSVYKERARIAQSLDG